MKLTLAIAFFAAVIAAGDVSAVRFPENPLLTLKSSPTIGDNINGPSVIKVPDWVPNKLGTYYMYFAHHRGMTIRLAYANSLHGPWKVYEPGVLNVSETAFYRPQPDPDAEIYGVYTHVASPEVYVDDANKRLIMWVHGQFSDGKKWPEDPQEGTLAAPERLYAKHAGHGIDRWAPLQVAACNHRRSLSAGLRTQRRVLWNRASRPAGSLSDPLKSLRRPEPVPRHAYNNQVRHVALFKDGDTLHVFLSVIGAAPEKIVHTTIASKGGTHGRWVPSTTS
jgi:hypothetical protein